MEKVLADFDAYGYALMPNAVPAADIEAMRRTLMPLLEAQPGYGEQTFVNRQGLLNDHPAFDALLRSEEHHAIASHLFGGGEAYKYGGCGVVLAKPGTKKSNGWHSDVPYQAFPGETQPEAPLMLNSIYALTDFNQSNGATRIVPLSHHARRGPPAREDGEDLRHAISVEMPAGSVLVFHGRLWVSALFAAFGKTLSLRLYRTAKASLHSTQPVTTRAARRGSASPLSGATRPWIACIVSGTHCALTSSRGSRLSSGRCCGTRGAPHADRSTGHCAW